MMITTKGKLKRGYGTGTGAYYKSWIKDSEFNSRGTTAMVVDWKTGRSVYLLSQAEVYYYYILRWDDNNKDIQEQYPLDMQLYVEAAAKFGISVKTEDDKIRTTDFLVTKTDGTKVAYSVKAHKKLSDMAVKMLCIEKMYWLMHGVDFVILYKDDVKSFVYDNIRMVTRYYSPERVMDGYTLLLHKIATKEIYFDMSSEPINREVLERYVRGDRKCLT